MDNAMIKRGIGAVVLAIIAALLLGYMLKDKNREQHKAQNKDFPTTTEELTIPSLTEPTVSTQTSSVTPKEETTTNTPANTNTNTTTTVAANTNAPSISSSTNPGFSFRPPTANEEQLINNGANTDTNTATNNQVSTNNTAQNTTTAANTTPKTSTQTTVVAAQTNSQKTFKPTIEASPKKQRTNTVTRVVKTPTKTTASNKPKRSKTHGGKYSIQLLATSSKSRANKLAQTMKNEGYISFITQTSSNNKILYRVRVGGHNSRKAALKAQKNMQKRYLKNFFVQNSLVVSN